MNNFSLIDEYKKASKSAKVRYYTDIAKGKSGYILSLDSILKKADIVAEVPLGIKSISLKKILGTYFYTRSRDFATNFLPLANENSEFSMKWQALYAHHINDGIRDPIKIYEYMNDFYVMEGNKRVSVLNYVDAYSIYSIEGEVTRLVPKRDEKDLNNIIYYEFLEFNNKTGINDIWFTKVDRFTELGKYLDEYDPKLDLFPDKYQHFLKNVYSPFRNTFYELGGEKLDITTGDALLEYIRIYGISDEFKETKRKSRVHKFLEELRILSKNNAVDIQTEPFDVHKKNVITSFTNLVVPHKKLRVAFVFEKTIKTSGWSYVHNIGRVYAQKQLEGKVETFVINNFQTDGDGYEVLRGLCEDSYIWDHFNHERFKDIELVISCGDLKADYLEYIANMIKAPVLYVNGNHDTKYLEKPPGGCIPIDDKIYVYKKIRILGLGGSIDYNKGVFQYSQKTMFKRVSKLKLSLWKNKGFDILVTHSPAKGIGDGKDRCHQGFEAFVEILNKYSPRYFFMVTSI